MEMMTYTTYCPLFRTLPRLGVVLVNFSGRGCHYDDCAGHESEEDVGELHFAKKWRFVKKRSTDLYGSEALEIGRLDRER